MDACENVKMSIRQDSPDEDTSGPQTKITEKEQLLKKLTQLSFITLATIFTAMTVKHAFIMLPATAFYKQAGGSQTFAR